MCAECVAASPQTFGIALFFDFFFSCHSLIYGDLRTIFSAYWAGGLNTRRTGCVRNSCFVWGSANLAGAASAPFASCFVLFFFDSEFQTGSSIYNDYC